MYMYTYTIIILQNRRNHFIKYVFWIILDRGAHSITSRYVCSLGVNKKKDRKREN